MKRLLLLALLGLALIPASVATGKANYQVEPRLSPVASLIAGQQVEVRCYDHDEDGDPLMIGAWAYVYLTDPVIYLSREVCDGAKALATGSTAPLWELGLGALALTHEAYHLKLALPEWRRGSEAQTECRAVKRVRRTILDLGASPALADAVLPWALAAHYKITSIAKAYDWSGCKVPVFADFWP